MADEPYQFRLPIRLLRIEDGYRILDASDTEVCFIRGRRGSGATTTFMTMEDAEQVAKSIAKMIRATGFAKF